MAGLLARVGEKVEEYFARAQSVICRETVRVQSLGADLLGDGSTARQVVSDLRIAWLPATDDDPTPEANVLRDVVSVNGRPPRPKDKAGCMDPKPVSPEPLAILLPSQQHKYKFNWAGLGRVDGHAAAMVDYRSIESGPIQVSPRDPPVDDCFEIELPGKTRGRVWIDQETGDVLRFDEGLTGIFDVDLPSDARGRPRQALSVVVERADVSIRYKRVAFQDPVETLMLPASIDTLTVIRSSGVPRVRKTQVFSHYRRFVTDGRIIQ